MKKLMLLLAVFACAFTSCTNSNSKGSEKFTITLQGETMGTYYHIVYLCDEEKNYKQEIDSVLADFSQSLSTYIPTSLISKINSGDSLITVDNYLGTVFIHSKEVFNETGGAFDPTVAPIVNAWGFGFKNMENVDSVLIDSLMQYVGLDKVSLTNGVIKRENNHIQLDFNAIAKGYGVDVVADYLMAKGITNLKVEIGGELVVKGHNAEGGGWRIGIEKPAEEDTAQGMQSIITFTDKGMATSGNYRKFYYKNGVKYSHTINPKTGYPVHHNLLSATVVANNCMIADAYATACMVMGLEKAKQLIENDPELEAYFIYTDSTGKYLEYITEGLKGMVKTVE